MELLSHPVRQPIHVFGQVVVDARHLAQLDDGRVVDAHLPEAWPVRTQRVGQHEGVAPVVLGTDGRVAVPEPIQLLRVDGVHVEASLDEALDDGTARNLDRDGARSGFPSQSRMSWSMKPAIAGPLYSTLRWVTTSRESVQMQTSCASGTQSMPTNHP